MVCNESSSGKRGQIRRSEFHMTSFATAALTDSIHSRLLQGIPKHDQHLILGVAEKRYVVAKETIIHAGDPAVSLFLLCDGHTKYYRVTKQGQQILLSWVSPGDTFGLASILPRPPGYIGSAEAIEDCTFLVWKHSEVRHLSHVYPQLAENALRIACSYLAAYSERHVRLATGSAKQRVAGTILRLAHKSGHARPFGMELDITNEQLSSLADVGIFTASRLLSEWERRGAIVKERGKIRIHVPEKLLAE
jgi:CRP/FNR family transcriptional regulator, nitrogen oxide reductase regulator